MRDPRQIIRDAGGVTAVQRELRVRLGTVQSWHHRNRIPAPRWAAFVKRKWASYRELAASVRVDEPPAPQITWATDAAGVWTVTIPPGVGRDAFRYAMDGQHRLYRDANPDPG